MQKYLTVFNISWQNGFVYRLNFILWRVRILIGILITYYLWTALFQTNKFLFGYTKEQMLSYVFLTLILRSIILSAKSMDAAGEIQEGKLSNFLLRPLKFHLYWFAADIADKSLNILFSIFEILALFLLLRPPLFLQSNPEILLLFIISVILAVILYFLIGNIASNMAFWLPGNAWGFWFLLISITELLGGLLFPMDILPKSAYQIIMLLPFPYLIYFPANLYLGQFSNREMVIGFGVMFFWIILAFAVSRLEWKKGLVIYEAQGR